jgi:uncharacterized membrane protein
VCFAIALAVFGSIGGCLIFTGVCFAVKLVLFYFHERIWHQIAWGKSMEQRCIEPYERGESARLSDVIDELRTEMHKRGVVAIFNGRRVVGFPAVAGYERIARLSGIKAPTVTYANDRYGRTGILSAGQRLELSCDADHPTIIDVVDTSAA